MDIQLLYGIIGLLGGVLVGIAVWWLIQQRLAEKKKTYYVKKLYSACGCTTKALVIPSLQQQIAHLEQELRAQREIITSQEAELREVTTRWEESRISAEEKQRLLLNSEQRLATQFENLANRIF